MKFPKFLPDGGTIGFVAPSFGCATSPYQETFEHAQKRFTELGYRLDLGPNCYESSGVGISNTPEKCAQELMDYYVKSDNDCLISCGGGELMCEILPYMDFDRLAKADPKWYMGYSDNTNMTYLLATLADTASIYGPCAGAFGMELWHPAISDAFRLLTEETLCPPDLLTLCIRQKWLPEAVIPGTQTAGLVTENADFIARHSLLYYYRGD